MYNIPLLLDVLVFLLHFEAVLISADEVTEELVQRTRSLEIQQVQVIITASFTTGKLIRNIFSGVLTVSI